MAGKLDNVGIIWLRCPQCSSLFYVEDYFFKTEYQSVKVHCPFCHLEFLKEEAPQTWKPPGV